MNRRWVNRLYEQLPVLVEKGILSPETAGRLRDYYGSAKTREGQRAVVIIFSILGSLCIGLGIILLLAYNWNKLPLSTRTILSFVPLILAQFFVFRTMFYRKESDAWKEGTASFLFLMAGASIALVTQTYHISADYFDFTLVWMLMGLPLVYLMRATVPAVIYFIGITVWTGLAKSVGINPIFFWPLAVLIVPYIMQTAKNSSYAVRSAFLGWVVSLCLCIAVGVTLAGIMGTFGIIIYSCFFSALYLTGLLFFNEDSALLRFPFQTVGMLGILVISYILTFHLREWADWNFPDFVQSLPEYLLAMLIAGTFIFLLMKFIRRNKTTVLLFALLPFVAVLVYTLSAFSETGLMPSFLANLYLLALGVTTIAAGVRNERLDTINGGMIILIVWIAARFFDWKVGFIIRGIAFIVIGSGFLFTNSMLIRRRRSKG